MLTVRFRDLNPHVVAAVATAFAGIEAFDVQCGDIWSGAPVDAVVSPANAFGFMDGGIDAVYVRRFGPGIEQNLQELIRGLPERQLNVGEAIIVATGDPEIPNMIAAPTMELPGPVPNTINAFLAFRAVLRTVHHCRLTSILCPGLATLTGRMPPDASALQMRQAWDRCASLLHDEP